MKKLLILLVSVAVCALLALGVMADTQVPTTCQACGTTATWTVLPSSVASLKAGHYHYYLSGDVTPGQLIFPENVGTTVCLDLNGHSIQTDGRAMYIKKAATVNLMDSSAGETGFICGSTGSNNTASGSVHVANGGKLNLYSGTIRFQKDDVGLGVTRGGTVGLDSGSQMQMFGGKIEGGALVTGNMTDQGKGGAIYMAKNCQLLISGGQVTSGAVPEGSEGPCIYAGYGTSKVTLTGTAWVEELCGTSLQDNVIITGTYTGYARLRSVDAAPAYDGMVAGAATNADITNANLFCTNAPGFTVSKSGNCLVLKPYAPTPRQHWCDHCKDIVLWTSYSSGKALLQQAGHHHLYLDAKYTGTQINPLAAAELCLDLHGQHIYSDGRAFNLKEKGKIHVMDTVGGSTVTATSANTNPAGGAVAVNSGAQLDIYGGTYTAIQDGSGYGIGAGGVLYMGGAGTINFYGGIIQGAELVKSGYTLSNNGYGAAVYLGNKAVMNVYGGEILSGTVPTGCLGECVYLAGTTAQVHVYGSGSVEEIYSLGNHKQLTVHGVYTGETNLRLPDSITVRENMAVGACVDADVSGAKLKCLNGAGYVLLAKEGELITSSFGLDAVAAVYNPDSTKGYNDLQAAVDACDGGYVKLMKSVAETVTVTKDLYIDTNGQTASVILSQGVTLYGFDSQTDDYTVADGVYGKLTVTGGKVKGLPLESAFATDGYLAVTENGVSSFHRVTLQVYAMSLRTQAAGLYYKSHFYADEVAAPQIASFGVALNATEEPNPENLETTSKYSEFTGFAGGAEGNPDSQTGTMLTGILKARNSDKANARHLNITIYGRAYAKTADGQLLLGQPVERCLAQQLELACDKPETLTTEQVEGVIAMYEEYETVLKNLQLSKLLQIMDDSDTFLTSQLVVGGKTDYVVVYDDTAEAKALAEQVVKLFKDAYGVTLQSYAASQRAETDKEIVIGMGRGLSHKAARKLTLDGDFAMLLAEKKLLLYAENTIAYNYLGQYLKREVLLKGTDLTLDSGDNLIYSGSALKNTTYVDYLVSGGSSITLADHFAYASVTYEGTTLPYRIYVPSNYDPGKDYPLLVTLHGAGLRGTNNTRQLNLVHKAFQNPNLDVDEAIIIYPQCPEDNKWVDTDWGKGSYDLDAVPESNEMETVMALISQLQQDYSVDAKRIYAIGYSMGGYGTWNALMNHPEVFAAGVPMCGAGDPTKAEILKDMPIWAIHGAKDPTVPVSGSRDMAAALEAVGATDFHYTELPNHEHDVWNYTYENEEIFLWLFSRSK